MDTNKEQPLVSIGIATYNRPKTLRIALQSITKQTYKNLEIVVSNDCSPVKETEEIIKEFMRGDSRIKYYYQEENITSFRNIPFTLEKATGEFFMWASDDDQWHERIIEIAVRTLLDHPDCSGWCCTLNNVDGYDRVVREFPGFSRFSSTSNKRKDIIKYLLEPEIMGKSNIFHGVHRTIALKETMKRYTFNSSWGSDVCFSLAFLVKYNLIGSDEVLFYKQLVRPSDSAKEVDPIIIRNPARCSFPFNRGVEYIQEIYKVVRNTPYRNITLVIMMYRWLISFRNKCVGRTRSLIRGIKYCSNLLFSFNK